MRCFLWLLCFYLGGGGVRVGWGGVGWRGVALRLWLGRQGGVGVGGGGGVRFRV